MERPRYQEIADALRTEVVAGAHSGGRLPSEAELAGAYAASRVTVRRALEVLRDEGLVVSRQGYGWVAAADPVRQSLGRLGTIEAQLAELGVASERRVLDFGFGPAPARVRRELGAHRVLTVRRLNLADGDPFARVTVWCPERLARTVSLADVERATFHDLLTVDLGGATQTVGAEGASAGDAALLGIEAGTPVLVCRRLTRSLDGDPVLSSEHVFPGRRTQFVVELARADDSMAPSGLRLVAGRG